MPKLLHSGAIAAGLLLACAGCSSSSTGPATPSETRSSPAAQLPAAPTQTPGAVSGPLPDPTPDPKLAELKRAQGKGSKSLGQVTTTEVKDLTVLLTCRSSQPATVTITIDANAFGHACNATEVIPYADVISASPPGNKDLSIETGSDVTWSVIVQ